ncbi:MAG TPA: T9SS type A sorting domain-containing protein, partial [Candidatus Cloacimonadota bacterium]|nr:T9SS type A sorting domain-containing protein [Candidatus Cloacimonadota bacterium]
NGDTASIVAYIWDSQTKTDYTSYFAPMKLSDQAVAVPNTSAPQIELYLSSLDFRAGDTVGETPMLIARISDENGINIAGNAGRDILLVIDGSLQPIAVTGHFSYDLDSYTQGMLYYQLPKLSEGSHTVQLIAFDSFNLPAVASTTFIVKTLGNFFLDRFLIYPNPMQRETSFTFILSDDADLTISIYTIRGRKIRQIETSGRQGFNAIPWDGRDNQGSRIANNTYFVKIRARNSSGTSIEKTERVVVYN